MAMTARYTVLEGEVVSELRSGVEHDYVPDPLGSTVALLNSTQTQTDTFTYWPYGENTQLTGTTPTPFRFVGTLGYYRDSASKTYVRARHLDTAKGRWLTQDPIGFNGGDFNLYRYISNNPITEADPKGLYADNCGAPPQPPQPSQPPPCKNPPKPNKVLGTLIGYGCYCGGDRNPFRNQASPPAAYDAIDACCRFHDMIYKQFNCNPYKNITKPYLQLDLRCIAADIRLCNCSKQANCNQSPDKNDCIQMSRNVATAFCTIALLENAAVRGILSPV